MAASELMPCPFCGAAAKVRRSSRGLDAAQAFCPACDVFVIGMDAQSARERWNRRPGVARIRAEAAAERTTAIVARLRGLLREQAFYKDNGVIADALAAAADILAKEFGNE
jgi:hypothetical protein